MVLESKTSFKHQNSLRRMLEKRESGPDADADITYLTPRLVTIFCALVAALGYVTSGTLVAWSSHAISVFVDDEDNIMTLENIWIIASLAVGAILGPLIVHKIYYYIGTKYLVLMSSALAVGSWLLVSFFAGFHFIIAGRVLGGLSIGFSYVLIPLYLNELASNENRYLTDNILYVGFGLGVLIQYVIGIISSLIVIGSISCVIPILAAIGFVFLPESPRYLALTGREKEAKTILQKFRLFEEDIDTDIAKWMDETLESTTLTNALKSCSNICLVLPSVGLYLFEKLIGVHVMLAYFDKILSLTGGGYSSKTMAIMLALIYIASIPVYNLLGIKLKDRTTLLVSSSIMLLMMIVVGGFCHLQGVSSEPTVTYAYVPLLCLGVFIFMYTIGIHRLSGKYLYASTPSANHFQIKVLATSGAWIFNLGLLRLLPVLITYIGVGWVYWNIAIVLIFTLLFIVMILPDNQPAVVGDVQLIESTTISKCTSSEHLEVV